MLLILYSTPDSYNISVVNVTIDNYSLLVYHMGTTYQDLGNRSKACYLCRTNNVVKRLRCLINLVAMCRLEGIFLHLALVILLPCTVKACTLSIYSNSLTGFTLQQFVNESDDDFDAVQWTISDPCDHSLASDLVIICAKNVTLQDIEDHMVINGSNGPFCESRNAAALEMNIVGCRSVKAKSMRNITMIIENCAFTNLLTAGSQTVLNFSSTNATINNCSFTSMNNDTIDSDPMIVATSTKLSLMKSKFIVQSGKMIYIEHGSEMNITNTTFCNSIVTQHGDHPALIKVLNSTIKLENSIIENNRGGLIVSAKNCKQVSIINCHFLNNDAWECTFCASQSNVSIQNTSISENIGKFSVIYLVKTNSIIAGDVTYLNNNGSFLVRSSDISFEGINTFENCKQIFDSFSQAENFRAKGTLTVLQSTVYLLGNTTFFDNHSDRSGGAMYVSETMMFIYGNLIVTRNRAEKDGGGAFFYRTHVFCSAACIFTNNTASFEGGAINAVDSLIMLRNGDVSNLGLLNVSNNIAYIGGGINLEINSKIYGLESSQFHYKIIFARNTANFKGGAIHVNDSTYSNVCASKSYMDYDVHAECFLQILHDDEDIGVQNSSITFTDNFANYSGSILHGGLLDRCTVSPMATIYNSTFHSVKHITPRHALAYFETVTGLNLTSNNFDGIASESLRICFCQENKTDCKQELPDKNIKRGEEFNISVTVVDQVNRSASEKTLISIYLEPESDHSTLGKGQQLQFVETECSHLAFNIFSSNEISEVTLVVYVDDNPCIDAGLSNRTVKIYFTDCTCPVGFQEDTNIHDRCTCVCHDAIKDYVEACNPENATFLKKKNSWIGYIDDHNNSGYLVYPNCPYDYCEPPLKVNISLNNTDWTDAQCAYNRTGLLCGRCKDGFQLSTATPRCLQCTSKGFIGTYIASFVWGGIGGMLMVLLFLMLNVTVVQGTVNGLIFYANIVIMSRSLFFPSLHPNFSTVFIYFINTRLGFDRCLPHKVDDYQKMWHFFLFPIYALSLVVAIILLSKYSSRCARIIGRRNPVATLATIILLMYTMFLQAVTDILAFAILKYPNGSREVVWLPDASVKYFKGKHIPLFLVAVFILILGLAYTFLLFAWQWLTRAPNKFPFRWIRNTKLHLFMEVYHAPYKPKYRYWTGLLLFIRILLNIIVMANKSGNPRTNLLAIIILVAFLFLLKAYLGDWIYKQRLLDCFETTYYFNLLLFSLVSFNSAGNLNSQIIAIHVSVGITFIMTMCTLLYHIHYTLYDIKSYKNMSKSIVQRIIRKKDDTTNIINTSTGEKAKVHYKPTNTEVWLSSSLGCSTEEETCKKLGVCTLNLNTRETVTESQISEHCTTDLREPLLEQL